MLSVGYILRLVTTHILLYIYYSLIAALLFLRYTALIYIAYRLINNAHARIYAYIITKDILSIYR